MKRRSLIITGFFVVMLLFLSACSSGKGTTKGEPSFKGEFLISAEEAVELIGDENTVFVDCTGEASKGTVKGAVATTWQELCTCSDEYGVPGDDGWGKLPELSDLAQRLGALGLDKDKEIITLGHTLKGWGEDARVAWELRAAGYENVRIVDGGIDALYDAGAEKVSEPRKPNPCGVEIDSLDRTHIIETSELKENFDQYKIVDVRKEAEYNGATRYDEARGGHIKGAVLIQYLDLFRKDGTLKSNDEITEMFESQGITKTDRVVTYCTGGIRSAYTQMVLEMCGYENTYNYDQSYWNWCTDGAIE